MDRSRKSLFAVGLLLAVSLGLSLFAINWGLPNGPQDWANDSVAPLEPLAYAKRMIYQEPWSSKYPPFHFMLLALLYAPYAIYLILTGGLSSPTDVYPYGLQDPEFSLTVFTLIARFTSAFMGAGIALVTYYTVKRLYDERAGFISAFLIATSNAIVYYSHNANIDVPHLFWISLALYSFVLLLETYQTKYYVLLALFAALAIGTKNSAFAIFPGLAVGLLYSHWRRAKALGKTDSMLLAFFDRKLLYALLVLAITFALVFNIPFNWEGFLAHVQWHLQRSVRGSHVLRESASAFQGHLTLITNYLIFLAQTNGWPSFLLMAGGFFYCLIKFPQKFWLWFLPVVSYYVFFLQLHGSDNLRYILPVYLLLTWPAGKLAADLLDPKKLPRLVSGTALFLILGHSLLYGFSLDLLLTRDSRYTAEAWMKENIPSGSVIAAHGPYYSLPRFPSHLEVRRVNAKYTISEEVQSVGADYLVLDMSLPFRLGKRSQIQQVLEKMGFQPLVSFKSTPPAFAPELFNAVNPEIAIFKHVDKKR